MSDDLRERLRALAGPPPSDVPNEAELRHRARRVRGVRLGALATSIAVLAVAVGTVAVLSDRAGGEPAGVAVSPPPPPLSEPEDLGGLFLRAVGLNGEGREGIIDLRDQGLQGTDVPIAELVDPGNGLFQLAPFVVPHPSEPVLVYSSWEDLIDPRGSWPAGMPTAHLRVRVHDLETGADEVLVDGAHGVALAADGRFATVVGESPEWYSGIAFEPQFPGHIVVSDDMRASGEAWTTEADDYEVFGWAGGSLIGQRIVAETEGIGNLIILHGPGDVEMIAEGTRPLAISPDGSTLLAVKEWEFPFEHDGDNSFEPEFLLVDVESRQIVATVPSGTGMIWDAVTWVDDVIVLSGTTGDDDGSWKAVLAVASTENGITMDAVHDLDDTGVEVVHDAFVLGGEWVAAIGSASFASEQGDDRFVLCPLRGDEPCEVFELDGPAKSWLRRVRNPSKPMGDSPVAVVTGAEPDELL